jgi:hypothetical protein
MIFTCLFCHKRSIFGLVIFKLTKRMKQKQLNTKLQLLCIISLTCYVVNAFFTDKQQNTLTEINSCFDLSIREDKSSRMNNIVSSVHQGSNIIKKTFPIIIKNDKIEHHSKIDNFQKLPQREKDYRVDHTFLQHKNPIKIHTLDSLFKTKLQESNIPLQTEILYIANNDTAHSTKNDAIYTSYSPLEKITTGLNDQIILQAFVKTPFLYRISKSISIATFLIFCLSTIGLVMPLIRKKDQALEAYTEPAHVTLALAPPKSLIQIAPTIFFDKEKSILIHNETLIQLTHSRLHIFTLIINGTDYFVATKTIKADLWSKAEDSKDAFNKTMERLRTDLKPISQLNILYDNKRKGYYLQITEDNTPTIII